MKDNLTWQHMQPPVFNPQDDRVKQLIPPAAAVGGKPDQLLDIRQG